MLGQLRQPPTVGATYLQDPGGFAAQIRQCLEDGIALQGLARMALLLRSYHSFPFPGHEDLLLMHMPSHYLKTSLFTGVFANIG